MQVFAVLFLAAVAVARPQTSASYNNGAVTTVTERTFTIRGDGNAASSAADKYYSAGSSSGVSSYSNGASGVSSYSAAPAQQSYSQQSYSQQYEAAAPAYAYQAAAYQAAAPAYAYQAAAPAVAYQAAAYQAPAVAYQAAAPAYAYQAASYQAAAPAYAYQAAAPAVAYQAAAYQAPAVAYQAVTAAPAVAYQAVTAAPAVAYKAVAAAPAYKAVSQRVESNYENNYNNNYESSVDQSQYAAGETKVFKHVYAFAAPEEPATRARISVQAPVSKRKHYKLVFIKAPSQQTIVDSDITLPAQEEEKTLIYLLSKDRKQVQPEIRIKQAEASKHAKPEVFFLKYKNEQEAQAIASGAISGQTADVPANGEIISDGSVSILGQSAGQSGFSGSSFDSSFRSAGVNSGASNVVYRGGFSSGNSGFAAGNSGFAAGNSGFAAGNSGFSSGVSSGLSSGVSSGLSSAALVSDVSPATTFTSGSRSGFSFGTGSSGAASSGSASSAGLSGGFAAYSQDPASVALQASESFESSTAGSLAL